MRRNTPLAVLHIITATSHLQRRKVLLIILRFVRRYLVMIRGWKKSYVYTNVLIASNVSVHLPHCGVRFNHVKLFVYGFSFLCRCTKAAWMVSCSVRMIQCITQLYVRHCFYIMSPALSCKSSIQFGNPEQCVLVFTHLLSSSCTYYLVPFCTHVCAYCKCISLVV